MSEIHETLSRNTQIVDFYCAGTDLAIELDGGQHYSDEEGLARDRVRDHDLATMQVNLG